MQVDWQERMSGAGRWPLRFAAKESEGRPSTLQSNAHVLV